MSDSGLSTTTTLEVAASRSLRNHYTRDLVNHPYEIGRRGKSICQTGGVPTNVYDDVRLLNLGLERDKVKSPRVMCKLCVKKAGLSLFTENDIVAQVLVECRVAYRG